MSTVVIGANYGDEGKGLITDFEVRRLGARAVARFNGGAQAGHTVVDGDKRHVFGHVSSGTFAGAITYLSSDFIVNPLALQREAKTLNIGVGDVAAHRHARVSTIYDMVINGLIEIARGDKRHGSCGMGINETVTRHSMGPQLHVSDLFSRHFDLESFFKQVASEWVPFRLEQLNIDVHKMPQNSMVDILRQDPKVHAYALKEAVMSGVMVRVFDRDPVLAHKPMVFEGAQGLALDEELGTFPHVTRSRTGLVGAIKAAHELGYTELNPVYVTRVYLTRHGAGELAHEGETICDRELCDKTNVLNTWQGNFRYAPLNVPQLKRFIHLDYMRAKMELNRQRVSTISLGKPNLAVTCLDQVGDKVRMIGLDGKPFEIETENAAPWLSIALGINLSHTSRGPSAGDVTFHIINS